MQKVKILGKAGDLFTKELEFECNTATEAISAIDAHYKGFKSYICQNEYAMFYGPDDLSELTQENVKSKIQPVDDEPLNNVFPKDRTLYFIPKEFSGAFGIDLVVWLVIIEIILIIVSIVLQILLAPSPATQANEDESFEEGAGPSYILNGVRNTTKEGGRIPLVYGGPILVGSMVLSTKIDVNDVQDS